MAVDLCPKSDATVVENGNESGLHTFFISMFVMITYYSIAAMNELCSGPPSRFPETRVEYKEQMTAALLNEDICSCEIIS